MDMKITKKEKVEQAMKGIELFEKNNFYPEEAGQAYIICLKREDELEENILKLKTNLNRQMEIKEYFEEYPNKNHIKIIKNMISSYGYDFEYLETEIKNEIEKLEKTKDSLDLKSWDTLVNIISRKHFIETNICYHFGNQWKSVDDFHWLFNLKFNLENILKNTEKIKSALCKTSSDKAMESFIMRNKYELLEDNEIEPELPYEVRSYSVYSTNWEGETNLDSNMAKRTLKEIYFLSRPKVVGDEIENALQELSDLNEKNKKLFIDFIGCKIKFYKTQKTKIVFSKKIIENIQEEYRKEVKK